MTAKVTPECIAIAKRMREERATWVSIGTTLQVRSASIRRALVDDRSAERRESV